MNVQTNARPYLKEDTGMWFLPGQITRDKNPIKISPQIQAINFFPLWRWCTVGDQDKKVWRTQLNQEIHNFWR